MKFVKRARILQLSEQLNQCLQHTDVDTPISVCVQLTSVDTLIPVYS